MRFKKENILVPALWCGPVKPHGNTLLKAIFPDLQVLQKGVDMDIPKHNVQTVTGIVICGTGDLPARAMMLNMVAHNGESACQRCYQRGEPREGTFGVRVFPYLPNRSKELLPKEGANFNQDGMYPRDDANFNVDGIRALTIAKHYAGLKGTTLLSKLTLLPVKGTGIDAMHLIYAGCGRKMLKMFVDEKHSEVKGSVYKTHKTIVDERLLNIKPPAYITRVPKSTVELADWKTSMHKSFFLYYSLPVLKGIFTDLNLRHFSSLVAAVQLLNSDCVKENDLKNVEDLIDKFMSYFKDLYGCEFLTLNFHLLCHLPTL
ncbi:putative cysteine--tRNA ligase, mitochondrial [Frankliniella fusca]|uniref:Cysteine--tRNA ligase, mitochondrial n=1 Tax=Frankliniella fusca TaxID=407009 RepID=A0AAE1LNM0_9NEOP|nr:putative cysteine--tRNA ligase, mitochondrial [Frankliniella fusca]